jgi:hypothetical protein
MKFMQRMPLPVSPKDLYAWTHWRAVMQLVYKLLQYTVHRNFLSLPLLFKTPVWISFTFIINGKGGLNKPVHPSCLVAGVEK